MTEKDLRIARAEAGAVLELLGHADTETIVSESSRLAVRHGRAIADKAFGLACKQFFELKNRPFRPVNRGR